MLRAANCFGAAVRAELFVDIPKVRVDRVDADDEFVGDGGCVERGRERGRERADSDGVVKAPEQGIRGTLWMTVTLEALLVVAEGCLLLYSFRMDAIFY